MKNQQKNNTLLPLAIIGIVLILALGGGYMLYNSSKSSTANKTNTSKTQRASTPDNTAQLYASAPTGAQPAHILGSPAATVVIEEFADFQCGACAVKHPLAKEIASAYGSRIKFIFRNYPLQGHDKAYDAAVAAEAAGLQGKFWDMQNQLFVNQQNWSTSPDYRKLFEDYAHKIGLDVEKYKTDIAGLNAKTRVDADLQRARALRIQSTPTFFINGKAIPYEQLDINSMRQFIDMELQRTQSGAQNQPGAGGATDNNPANK